MYLLKTKGIGKIPDQYQLRNEQFEIVELFKESAINKMTEKYKLNKKWLGKIQQIPYGQLTKID